MAISRTAFATILIFLCTGVFMVLVKADDHEYRLVSQLMNEYDRRVRPSRNASVSLNVTFGLALAQIIDVDEKNQVITSNCWLNQAWIDYKLVWDPTEFGGIKVVRLPWQSIWRPDILLYNNADVSSYANQISSNMIVSHDGNVTWLSMVIFKSSCTIDVKYFPFDEQLCHMLFASWTYDGYQVNLLKVGDDGDITNYIPNSEWSLVKLHAERNVRYYSCCAEPYPDVTYSIEIRRKPLFYVFNMILPCFIITFVALLGFYMPSDSGEKVTMGITTLLSMTVFLMLVAESMPPTSDVLPLIGIYYGVTIAIVSLATACTVLTLNIHHKGIHGNQVPWLVKLICLKILARVLCMKQELVESPEKDSKKTKQANHHNPNYVKLRPVHSTHNSCAKSNQEGTNSQLKHVYYPDTHPETFSRGSNHQIRTIVNHIPQAHSKDFFMDASHERSSTPRQNGGITMHHSSHKSIYPVCTGNTTHSPTSGHIPNISASTLTSTGACQSPYSGTNNSLFEDQFIKTLQKVQHTIEKNEQRLEEQDKRDIIKNDWQTVGIVMDRLLLGVFVILTLTFTVGLMIKPPQGWKFWVGQTAKGIGEP